MLEFSKVKFGTDKSTFDRAVALYESGKVTKFMDTGFSYVAVVQGTRPYKVVVDSKYYDRGTCECYLGQEGTLCKHMVAVAIFSIFEGKEVPAEQRESVENPVSSGKVGELPKDDIDQVKRQVTQGLSFLKPYNGSSRRWFAYQNSLDEGCRRLSRVVSDLPISVESAKILVDILLRSERKLLNGVDDSNGTVGDFIVGVVDVLLEWCKVLPAVKTALEPLLELESTSFGWEEPLLELVRTEKM